MHKQAEENDESEYKKIRGSKYVRQPTSVCLHRLENEQGEKIQGIWSLRGTTNCFAKYSFGFAIMAAQIRKSATKLP